MVKDISSIQFYKEIMEEAKCSFQEAVACVLDLHKKGKITIVEYDNYGVPAVFFRTDNKPKDIGKYEVDDDIESFFR